MASYKTRSIAMTNKYQDNEHSAGVPVSLLDEKR